MLNEERVITLLDESGFEIVGRATIPARPAVTAPVPPGLHRSLREELERRFATGLFGHQAEAISTALLGRDVCLATATASGKSLVFMSIAADMILKDPSARVLALYPARALIQDQIRKWAELLTPLGLRQTYIDGGVPITERTERLSHCHVALMTPDVAHAWMMGNLHEPVVRTFLERTRLMILDEAHVYEGAFGTNMAFFLRRLSVPMGRHQLICSTATLGRPDDFVEQLTGRSPVVFGPEDDRSPIPPKSVLLANPTDGKAFECTVDLLKRCARSGTGRFLAFGDSRKAVERIVASCLRDHLTEDQAEEIEEPEEPDLIPIEEFLAREDEEEEGAEEIEAEIAAGSILPYRAGYETDDRAAIQRALTTGQLAGVVSTSALELGVDIGDIDLVILLSAPPSAKAFWQRVGRAGRRRPGVCVLIDPTGSIEPSEEGLLEYLDRSLEPNWLYLNNRYIQYANAMCAAVELGQLGRMTIPPELSSLPQQFVKFLENELNPTEIVPVDLYPLKQRGQDDPHHEFPLRGGVEQNFKIIDRGRNLGDVTLAQALREAYPGAVYYYMARPYRIRGFRFRDNTIIARPERHYTTHPNAQTKVFPRFQGGMLAYFRNADGFVVEAEMQVSERVLGFSELRGSARLDHMYQPGSPYSQRPLNRFFETTGVCWRFTMPQPVGDPIPALLLSAFCERFAIQERDLGIGTFFAKRGPAGEQETSGYCIYDATQGSLRLTQLLAASFGDVARAAADMAAREPDTLAYAQQLEALASMAVGLEPQHLAETPVPDESLPDEDWVTVIAQGQPAIFMTSETAREVVVLECRYTPRGLMYRLQHDSADWWVPVNAVQPVHGETKLVLLNLMTGETKPLDG